MIHLNFSYWWLLLPLALVLLFIIARTPGGSGPAGGLLIALVTLVCLAVFFIVLAGMVGFSIAHS